jgi:hypothetical protein
MAEADEQKLGELLAQIDTENEGLQAMLDGLAADYKMPDEADWAAAFEESGDTQAVDDKRQVTFVLEKESHAALMEHLKQYGNNKNEAIVAWLEAASS